MPEKKWILKCCLLIAFAVTLFLLVLIAGSGEAEGKTVTVDDDGGADYTKIQDAVDNAKEGDTIRVYEGIYEEHPMVNKRLDIIGNGSGLSTIDGDGAKRDVVTIPAYWVNFSAFSITGIGDDFEKVGIRHNSSNSRIMQTNISGTDGTGIFPTTFFFEKVGIITAVF